MKQYTNIEAGKPIRVSGWALVNRSTNEGVLSGQAFYADDMGKHGKAIVTNGTPPHSANDEGRIWCAEVRDESTPHRFGLRWVKLDSEGNPLL